MAKLVNAFEDWVRDQYAESGSFTALIVLLRIGRLQVDPVSSSWLHFIGDEVRWPDMRAMLSTAPAGWDGVAFFVGMLEEGGPLPDAIARMRLRELEQQLRADRLHLNRGQFFDRRGRRLVIEERCADA
jgi:hypothetical protein